MKAKSPKAKYNNKRMLTAYTKDLTVEQIAFALKVKVSDIKEVTVSHTTHIYNILEEPRYEYSTYQITIK